MSLLDASKPTTLESNASSATCMSTSLISVTTEESKPEIMSEIEADVAVVSNLKELEASFGIMIVKRHLQKCDLSEAKLFLYSTVGTTAFSDCENFENLLQQMQQDHIDVFNVSLLQQLLANFEKDKSIDEVIEAYNEERKRFLKQTTVCEF